ncbi:MAG: hypothetical protein ACTSUT_12980 [Promethearchaeota archaeon]
MNIFISLNSPPADKENNTQLPLEKMNSFNFSGASPLKALSNPLKI